MLFECFFKHDSLNGFVDLFKLDISNERTSFGALLTDSSKEGHCADFFAFSMKSFGLFLTAEVSNVQSRKSFDVFGK